MRRSLDQRGHSETGEIMALLYDNAIKQMFTKLYGNTQAKDTNFHPESQAAQRIWKGIMEGQSDIYMLLFSPQQTNKLLH